MKKIILAMVIFLVAFAGFVSAGSSDYQIDDVYVNDINAGNTVQVELNTKLNVDVYFHGTGETKDVKVRMWLGGYEYDLLEDYTEMFDVENGVNYKKTLTIEIPEDMDLMEDNYYNLYVEIYDSTDYEMFTSTVYFEEPRHKIAVKDIYLSNAVSDSYVGVKVRLTNLGENQEEDIRVTVSIPELSISARTYVDEMAARGYDTADMDDELTANTIYLKLPYYASGDYEVKVQVDYNNDHSTTEEIAYLRIGGNSSYDESALVSISTLNDLKVGKEDEFKIQITNLEDTKNFNIEVDGDFEFEYTEKVTVSGNTELIVKVTPLEAGMQSMRVKVYTDEGIVAENIYSYDVKEKTDVWPAIIGVILSAFIVVLAFFIIGRLRE
ncbi:MAG: hypothetical protein ABIJ18_04440 [archaeon]